MEEEKLRRERERTVPYEKSINIPIPVWGRATSNLPSRLCVCVFVHQHSYNALCMPFSFQLSNIWCYRENVFSKELFPNAVSFDVSSAAKKWCSIVELTEQTKFVVCSFPLLFY